MVAKYDGVYTVNDHVLNLSDFEGFSILSFGPEDFNEVALNRLLEMN